MSEEKTELIARRIPLAECAKLLRAALKREFPDVKFSVRCKQASMVSEVGITWCDGPTREAVEAVGDCYSASRWFSRGAGDGGFEPCASHWLCSDGRAVVAHVPALNDDEIKIGLPPSPDAELVSFSCSVRCERETEEIRQETEKARIRLIARRAREVQ